MLSRAVTRLSIPHVCSPSMHSSRVLTPGTSGSTIQHDRTVCLPRSTSRCSHGRQESRSTGRLTSLPETLRAPTVTSSIATRLCVAVSSRRHSATRDSTRSVSLTDSRSRSTGHRESQTAISTSSGSAVTMPATMWPATATASAPFSRNSSQHGMLPATTRTNII